MHDFKWIKPKDEPHGIPDGSLNGQIKPISPFDNINDELRFTLNVHNPNSHGEGEMNSLG